MIHDRLLIIWFVLSVFFFTKLNNNVQLKEKETRDTQLTSGEAVVERLLDKKDFIPLSQLWPHIITFILGCVWMFLQYIN